MTPQLNVGNTSLVDAEGLPECDLVRPLDASRIRSLAGLLSRVLRDEPHFRYMVPDPHERRRILSWFFNSVAIPTSLFHGEVYTTADLQAGVLWIRPESAGTFQRMLCTAVPAMSHVGRQMENVFFQLARQPHWYLVSLGVEPSKNLEVTGRALLEPVLFRADLEERPCYVESFHEGNLRFYESLGFRIEGAGNISSNGPNFWAMIRAPQSAGRPPDDRIADCSIS